MISSTKSQFQFKKVTSSKYIGTDGLSLILCKDNSYAICKDNKVTRWGTLFQSIEAAQRFLSEHDYINATIDEIGMNKKDADFIIKMYGQDEEPSGRYTIRDDLSISRGQIDNSVVINLFKGDKLIAQFADADKCIEKLDRLVGDRLVASAIIRGTELRSIFAARDRKTTREITKNLVRVKSSNVWAYGIEIKDNDAKVGDVYVQFKGKNGGPSDVYIYFSVPIGVWRKCLSSTSKGHAVWKYLRNNFPYSKLTGDRRGKLSNAINH